MAAPKEPRKAKKAAPRAPVAAPAPPAERVEPAAHAEPSAPKAAPASRPAAVAVATPDLSVMMPELSTLRMPDAAEFGRSMAGIAERSQRIVGEWLKRQATEGSGGPDPLNIGNAFLEMTAKLMANPAHLDRKSVV